MTDQNNPLPSRLAAMTRQGNIFSEDQTVAQMVRKGMASIKSHTRQGRIYASQAAVCARQAVLSATRNDDEMVEPAAEGYYALGIKIEEIVLKAIEKRGGLLHSQYRLPDIGLNMGGYVDGIIKVGGRLRVLEVKSCGELPKEPKLEHKAQALVYSAVTGLPPTLFYFSRGIADFNGTLRVREFAMNPTFEELRSALFTAAFAKEAIERDAIPAKPSKFTKESECGFCPWKDICWRGAPLPGDELELDAELDASNAAVETVIRLLNPDAVRRRRRGILRHIQLHGSKTAQEILAGDWSEMLEND